MKIKLQTYKYKDSEDSMEHTNSISRAYRNSLALDLTFNRLNNSEFETARSIIADTKGLIAMKLLRNYSLYDIRADYLNSNRSRLTKQSRETAKGCLTKNYDLSVCKLNVRIYKYDFQNFHLHDPNIIYASKNQEIFSYETLDSWVLQKLRKTFNFESSSMDKQLSNVVRISSFLDKTRLQITELEKIDAKILEEIYMLLREIEKDYS